MKTCCDRLLAEHRDTERQLDRLALLLNRLSTPDIEALCEDWQTFHEAYQLLNKDLNRHFALEERALFPLLSAYRTMMLMEVEHDDLITLQHAFEKALTESLHLQAQSPTLVAAFHAFQERLRAHIVEEDRGIFPLAEARFSPEEKQQVLRRFEELSDSFQQKEPVRSRPEPSYQVLKLTELPSNERPLSYQTLYDREHTQVQRIRIQAGHKQALHWVGPHQCLLVLSGELTLQVADNTQQENTPANTNTNNAQVISTNFFITLDSRLYFALEAITDAELLVFKVWPHPHYTKAD